MQTFSRFIVEADYFLNKSFIAKVLCINKERPQMHCNGKCYLSKQLQKQEKQDQQSAGTKKTTLDVQVFTLPEQPQALVSNPVVITKHFPHNLLKLSSFHHSVFHPPTV